MGKISGNVNINALYIALYIKKVFIPKLYLLHSKTPVIWSAFVLVQQHFDELGKSEGKLNQWNNVLVVETNIPEMLGLFDLI